MFDVAGFECSLCQSYVCGIRFHTCVDSSVAFLLLGCLNLYNLTINLMDTERDTEIWR